MPFDLGLGAIYRSFDLNFLDLSGTALNSDSLTPHIPYDAFPLHLFQFQLFNNDLSCFVQVQSFHLQVRQTGVPEPATWFLVVAGLGCLGAARRVR